VGQFEIPLQTWLAAIEMIWSQSAQHLGAVSMTAFNVVRFLVKPGREQEFLDAHRNVEADWPGLKKVNMIKTGERS
jgi:hypothetical protein